MIHSSNRVLEIGCFSHRKPYSRICSIECSRSLCIPLHGDRTMRPLQGTRLAAAAQQLAVPIQLLQSPVQSPVSSQSQALSQALSTWHESLQGCES